MKKTLGKIYFKLIGWKLKVEVDLEKAGHSVIIAAPHTSNWDLPHAIASFWVMGLDVKFFIKDFYTKWWFLGIFKSMGAIGVNRKKHNNLVYYAIQLLKENKQLVIMVPAEGTRKRVEKWKSGFYNIAKAANVPIGLGYLDYKNKQAGVALLVNISESKEKDLTIIENIYKKFTGKFPELYNPEIFIREKAE